MEDKQIIALLFSRSESAIGALDKRFGKGLLQMSMNMLGLRQDAEEAVNDTYLALWDAIPPARPDPLSAFVFKVGRNTCLKQLRTRSAKKRDNRYDLCLEELSQSLPSHTLEQTLDARALGRAIDSFLQTLDRESRCLFLRRYWFGDSLGQLSRLTGISENTLSVRLHRIRGKLKHHLIKEGFRHEA